MVWKFGIFEEVEMLWEVVEVWWLRKRKWKRKRG